MSEEYTRETLAEISSNTMPCSAEVKSSVPKPSSIPRLQTTPTKCKTNSLLTPYGYKSPKSENSIGSSLPKRGYSTEYGGPASVSGYDRRVHESIKREIEEKQTQLHDLRNAFLGIRTHNQQLEFDHQDLEDKLFEISKNLKIKTNDYQNISQKRKEDELEIEQDFQLKLKQMKVENDAIMYEMERHYANEIDNSISARVSKIQQRKTTLKQDIQKLNNTIDNSESTFQEELRNLKNKYETEKQDLCKFMEETSRSSKQEFDELMKNTSELENEISKLKSELAIINREKDEIDHNLKEIADLAEKEKERLSSLNTAIEEVQSSIEGKKTEINGLDADINTKEALVEQLQEILHVEEIKRRELHNRLQEMKGNIRVMCRIRPPQTDELDVIDITVPSNDEEKQDLSIGIDSKRYKFNFDQVFNMGKTNSEIFEEVSQLIQCAIDGQNVCIFAYGQTGSGKTFTMLGENGIIPKSIDHIFYELQRLERDGWKFEIFGEFLEIYNESINDLLRPGNSNDKKFEIRHDNVNKRTEVVGITRLPINKESWNEILEETSKNRSVGSTMANDRSSRSHSVFSIKIHGENAKGEKREGVLNLIDLAGSERLAHSQAAGDRLKETKSINKSLSCLRDVIVALGDSNSKHIPFRNSKLTYLLQYSLMGDSKTLMFVNVSPSAKHFNETVNSLRFATTVNLTKIKELEQ